jgi:hypothetical protein
MCQLLTLRMMGRMVIGEASLKNLSGPLTIADYAGRSASMGLMQYLVFLALISVSLGVLNLLPLPVLDGGHLMYYLWEGVTGKSVSDAWMERLQRGGVACSCSHDVYRSFQRYLPIPRLNFWPYLPSHIGFSSIHEKTHQSLWRAHRLCRCRHGICAKAAWALEPFKVQDIRVEGLQRVEPGTIFASMPLRVGDDYNDDKGAAAIRALFALGLFKDVRLEASGNVLVVVVEERPPLPTWSLRARVNSTRKSSRKPCAMWV